MPWQEAEWSCFYSDEVLAGTVTDYQKHQAPGCWFCCSPGSCNKSQQKNEQFCQKSPFISIWLVSRQAGEIREMPSNQLDSGSTKSTVPFPEPRDECGEVLHASQELLQTLLLQQGNWEWNPETGGYSSSGWLYSFRIFPSASVPGLFLTWTLVLATEAVFTG